MEKNPDELLIEECEKSQPSLERVQYLIEEVGADPNSPDAFWDTAFHYACKNENFSPEIIKFFIVVGKADPNIRNSREETPLHYFCDNENISLEMAKYFLVNGKANPNLTSMYGDTPFHCLCSNEEVSGALIELFLKIGKANPNIRNSSKDTPAHYLCGNKKKSPEIIRYLMESTVDPSIKNGSGVTVFDCIFKNKKRDKGVMGIFTEYASRDILNKIFYELCAEQKINFVKIEWLVKKVNLDFRSGLFGSGSSICLMKQNIKSIELLVNNGASFKVSLLKQLIFFFKQKHAIVLFCVMALIKAKYPFSRERIKGIKEDFHPMINFVINQGGEKFFTSVFDFARNNISYAPDIYLQNIKKEDRDVLVHLLCFFKRNNIQISKATQFEFFKNVLSNESLLKPQQWPKEHSQLFVESFKEKKNAFCRGMITSQIFV